jgi:hypothetical protein
LISVGVLMGALAVALVPTAAGAGTPAWTIEPTPSPGVSYLTGVSCTASSTCTAVGGYTAKRSPGLVETWDGVRWVKGTAPEPPKATITALSGVSCTGAMCMAVGLYYTLTNPGLTLAEVWNGAKWTVSPTPNPVGPETDEFWGVSCPSATSCIAVGETYSHSLVNKALAETWNGVSWVIDPSARPAGTTSSDLTGVSCLSATDCTAVGFEGTSAGAGPLAERWNGTRWTVEPMASSSGITDGELEAVSCRSAKHCMAVGVDRIGSGTGTLAESWSGSIWTVEPPVNPAGAPLSWLSGVSCPSDKDCIAVGNDGTQAKIVTLAERWDGASWTVEPTPNPLQTTKTKGSVLAAVSCWPGTVCTAVGDYQVKKGTTTLAEGRA